MFIYLKLFKITRREREEKVKHCNKTRQEKKTKENKRKEKKTKQNKPKVKCVGLRRGEVR